MSYRFKDVDNPHPTVLTEINPDLVVPDTYRGLNRDIWLARLVNQLVTTGIYPDVNAVAALTGSTYPHKRLEDVDGFLAVANRFNTPNPEFLYYTFNHVLDMNDQDNWYYILYLAALYGSETLQMSSTLMQLISIEHGQRIDTEVIDRFMDTNRRLRAEGIVLKLDVLYEYAKRWGDEGALTLLLKKVPLQDAKRLAEIGFTADQIADYNKVIPKGFIDDLLNPKPIRVDDDDDI